MTIEIYRAEKPYQDWVRIIGDYEQIHISAEADDYVEATAKLMQQAALKCFEFPFYIHFEGFEDEVEDTLSKGNVFEISYQDSGSTVLTTSNWKTYDAKIPSFTVKIPDADILKKAFKEWFDWASWNNMWVMTQKPDFQYIKKVPTINMREEPIFLIPDHDAYGFSVITNQPDYQHDEGLRRLVGD